MNVIDMARELGVALANSGEFTRLTAAREQVENCEPVISMLAEYREKEDRMVKLMQQDEDNRETAIMLTSEMDRIRTMLSDSAVFCEYCDAQEEFQKLLAAVNGEINACIGQGKRDDCEEGDCDGCCDHCGGCAH